MIAVLSINDWGEKVCILQLSSWVKLQVLGLVHVLRKCTVSIQVGPLHTTFKYPLSLSGVKVRIRSVNHMFLFP